MAAEDLTVPFTYQGQVGAVGVTVDSNRSPNDLGCPDVALGFPVCTATVSYSGRGYKALFGWVQLVGECEPSDGLPLRYSIDQFSLFEHLDLPYGFFGTEPQMFDAPWRSDRSIDLVWKAESYLCCAPLPPMERAIQPVAAFEWGFEMVGGQIDVRGPTLLDLQAWNRHVPLLASAHPSWGFSGDPDA